MKITEITRTISNGANYSNLSAKAVLNEGEDFIKACFELDHRLKEALDAINAEMIKKWKEESEDELPY